MPQSFISTGPYETPTGFQPVTLSTGGSGYKAPDGTLYYRTSGGLQMAPSTVQISQGSSPLQQTVPVQSTGNLNTSTNNYTAPSASSSGSSAPVDYSKQRGETFNAWIARTGLDGSKILASFASGYDPNSDPNFTNNVFNAPADVLSSAKPAAAANNAITGPVTGVRFKETAAYNSLSQEQKDLIDIAFNTIKVGGEEDARYLAQSIQQAQAIADPYYRSQLSLAREGILTQIAEQTGDFELKRSTIERTKRELMEDVAANRENLSLEQQAELARQLRAYDEDLLTIADQAAEKGLTFATGARSRSEAEARRTAQYQDVIQSDTRQFNMKMRELELRAARGETDAQAQLESIRQTKETNLEKIGQTAEKILGSGNLPGIEGYQPVGGIPGQLEEQKSQKILQDVAGFTALQKGFV